MEQNKSINRDKVERLINIEEEIKKLKNDFTEKVLKILEPFKGRKIKNFVEIHNNSFHFIFKNKKYTIFCNEDFLLTEELREEIIKNIENLPTTIDETILEKQEELDRWKLAIKKIVREGR